MSRTPKTDALIESRASLDQFVELCRKLERKLNRDHLPENSGFELTEHAHELRRVELETRFRNTCELDRHSFA